MIGQLTTNQPFDLELTLSSAQGHRWLPEIDDNGQPTGWYTSVLGRDLVKIQQVGGTSGSLLFQARRNGRKANALQVSYSLQWQFRLLSSGGHSGLAHAHLMSEPSMASLVKRYRGLRVMRVDPWECLVFFILAANSEIRTTHDRMEKISDLFMAGKRIGSGRYPFPSPTDILSGGQHALGILRNASFGLARETKYTTQPRR